MKEEDKKKFLEDFKKVEVDKKFDMWLFALEQEALWQEIIEEMSQIATKAQLAQAAVKKK